MQRRYQEWKVVSLIGLTVILIFCLIHLAGLSILYGQKILQMDFACYYTAGEALNQGLSPYENHVTRTPPLWDGVAPYRHARFVYPPIVGNFFQTLALMPYRYAKFVWMGVIWLCVSLVMLFTIRAFKVKRPHLLLATAIFAFLFYPLQNALERGQVDCLTILCIVGAVVLMTRTHARPVMAGFLLALATFIKLYALFILPFCFLRKKWAVVKGYALGLAVVLILSLAINRSLFFDYWFQQIPRISWVHEWGTPEMELPQELIDRVREEAGVSFGKTVKQGVVYYFSYQEFLDNASLVTNLGKATFPIYAPLLKSFGMLQQGRTVFSLGLFALFFLVLFFWQKTYLGWRRALRPEEEFIYWQIVLLVVLLCGIRTWSMNTIWFLPCIVILLKESASFFVLPRSSQAFLLFSWAGFALLALPDGPFLYAVNYKGIAFLAHKYVLGELILFAGLLGILAGRLKQ